VRALKKKASLNKIQDGKKKKVKKEKDK